MKVFKIILIIIIILLISNCKIIDLGEMIQDYYNGDWEVRVVAGVYTNIAGSVVVGEDVIFKVKLVSTYILETQNNPNTFVEGDLYCENQKVGIFKGVFYDKDAWSLILDPTPIYHNVAFVKHFVKIETQNINNDGVFYGETLYDFYNMSGDIMRLNVEIRKISY